MNKNKKTSIKFGIVGLIIYLIMIGIAIGTTILIVNI